MPFITVNVNTAPDDELALIDAVIDATAVSLDKPSKIVSAVVRQGPMRFFGTTDPCAVVQVETLVPVTDANARALVAALCDAISKNLDVDIKRTWVTVSELPSARWGSGGVLMSEK